MQIPLLLDRSRPASLTSQIAEQLRDAILQGRIAPGARMPSSRKLAEQIDVSRNTVVRAYEWLTIEGYVEARAASGVFATQRLPDRPQPSATAAPTSDAGPASPMPMPYGPLRAPDLVNQNRSRLAFDFFPGRPSAALFPLKTWRRLLHLPPGVPDAPVLEGVARRARVGVYALASGGAYDAEASVLARRGIILGYAALLPRQIEQGIARLSEAIDDALELPSASAGMAVVRAAPARGRASDAARHPAHLAPRFLQQPALRADTSRRASSRWNVAAENDAPMPVVSAIYRYPIKGLSAQRLSSVVLHAGQPMPHDRAFALARPFSPVESYAAKWAKKGLFVMLMLDEALASVRTQLDVDTLELRIMQGNQQVLAANLGSESGRADVEEFYRALVTTLNGAPRLVRAQDGHFMDKPDNVLSLINLATVRSLEKQWGFEIDPLRFRANVYIDGAQPWEEFDWIGRDIVLGDALFRVDRRNGRCGATNVNPASGRRDLDIPGSLRAAFGHKDLGVYLVTRKTGEVSIGAPVTAPRGAGHLNPAPRPGVHAANGQRRFICRGCYFIYEEERGLPQQSIPAGTGFGALPDAWQCPDCGTEKTNFRPHVAGV